MMEYRKLPHGDENIGVLGIGMGCLENTPDDEIVAIVTKAIEHGVNYFDMCAGGANVYKPFGEAIRPCRDKVYFPIHFGAVYNEKGAYGWTRDADKIKSTFDWEMKTLDTDYADFGFLHCVDQIEDYEELKASGIVDFMRGLKDQGVLRHLGFSSHTVPVAERLLDDGFGDMILFSINAAYDLEQDSDELGGGTVSQRAVFFNRCRRDGVGISVMKPFHGGKLLDAAQSPFHTALTATQCLQYVIDRPGVMTAVPGVKTLEDLNGILKYIDATPEERDYSAIAGFSADRVMGHCVYCGHCKPCPMEINIDLVNKYYDLARIGDRLAADHYRKLSVNADA